ARGRGGGCARLRDPAAARAPCPGAVHQRAHPPATCHHPRRHRGLSEAVVVPIRDWSNFIGGRTALVTGSGAGVGRAIAMHMARAGAEVWINDLDRGRAEKVVSEIEAEGGKAHPVIADVCDPAQVKEMARTTGPVDILVNNAGSGIRAFADQTAHYKLFVETDPSEWEPVMRVNLTGVLHVTHTYLPDMIEHGWGRILTIVSDAGRK